MGYLVSLVIARYDARVLTDIHALHHRDQTSIPLSNLCRLFGDGGDGVKL